jgi:hypothetical protein
MMTHNGMPYLGLRVLCTALGVYHTLLAHVEHPKPCQDMIGLGRLHIIVTPQAVTPIYHVLQESIFRRPLVHSQGHKVHACHTIVKECTAILHLHRLTQCLHPHRLPKHNHPDTGQHRKIYWKFRGSGRDNGWSRLTSMQWSEFLCALFPEMVPSKVTPSFALAALYFIINWASNQNNYIAEVMVDMWLQW